MPPPLAFAPASVEVDRRADGTIRLRSPQALGPHPPAITDWLTDWAARAPDRPFLAERQHGAWTRRSYVEVWDSARALGQGLLDRGADADRPVIILSDNSLDHAELTFAALHVGVPVVPVSPAYSLLSTDFGKLRHVFALVDPSLVWTDDPARFAAALDAVDAVSTPLESLRTTPTCAVDRAHAAVTRDTVAKILFTSGSTGQPKGVVNTHGMLTANQQMLAQGWPFIERRPPVIVDWLPWNHTFGGNHNLHLVLRNGGTLYIDGGRPAPTLIAQSARNLAEVSPTIYFNVPRGFDLLLPHLEADAALRRSFFAELDAVFYAAAALPQNLWTRLEALAHGEGRGDMAMLSAWGSTETSPLATQVHFHIDRAGVVGLPVAGCELKLVPAADKLEVRVRGAHVTPGYYKRPDLTAAAFDEDGFYLIGDAMRFADAGDCSRGLVFDGRVAEDFKLLTGTWVHTGALRVRLIAAGNPVIQDAVITGHDRDDVGALVFPSAAGRALPAAELRARVADALRTLRQEATGSSTCVARALVMAEAPSIDAGEITDKGYINQGAVLARRTALVDALYAGGDEVVVP